MPHPWYLHILLLNPDRVAAKLERIRAAGLLERTPNEWQIALGVLRMAHRLVFRSDTVGTSKNHPVRATWRARLLQLRPLRFPFLLAERAVAPLDLSGLLSSPERVIAHLLGAHHDGQQFVYDLQMLSVHEGALERVREEAMRVITRDDPRSRWLRDLVVFERYHESLLAAVDAALAGEDGMSEAERRNPDVSFLAYLAWCAAQPATPEETLALLRQRRYSIEHGRVGDSAAA